MSTLVQQLLETSLLEWFGTATGLLAVALSVRQHRGAWPLFIACYGAYVGLSVMAGLYAAAGMNAVFVVLSLIGWRAWAKNDSEEEGGPVPTPGRTWAIAAGVWVGATLLLGGGLSALEVSEAPWLDAGATAAGFVAQWLLTRKLVATWSFWLVSDIGFMVLYARAGYWLTVGLFGVFLLLALQGMLRWRRQLAEAA